MSANHPSIVPVHAASPYATGSKIRIHNSLGGVKSEFNPIDTSSPKPAVRIYVCGLTPYDHPHLGHAVMALRFEMVRRYLEYRNLQVIFQTNLTDIDDKIIRRANETGEVPGVFTERFSEEFQRGTERLGVTAPTYFTKVTETLAEIKQFIADLIANGFAYVTESGNVYFDIAKKSDYGKLSGQKLSELIAGTRDREPDPEKRSPADFALWKRDDSVLSGDSPWGLGRPGWHIECSAMIHHKLGAHIDIHGGGLDLKFPHHENEIAQSEAHNGIFVNFWMHAGLLTVENQKMSKSLGNFFTIEQALNRFGAELIRFVLLRVQYRSEVGFSDQLFRENLNSLVEFYKVLSRAEQVAPWTFADFGASPAAQKLIARFESAMNNDFGTPEALVALSESLAELRKLVDSKMTTEGIAALGATIRGLGEVLGILSQKAEEVYDQCIRFSSISRDSEPQSLQSIQALLTERETARAARNFARSDEIRDRLAKYGLEALDRKGFASDWRFLS